MNLTSADEPEVSKAERLFVLHVQPLLQQKCLACHGQDADNIEGGFDLSNRDVLLNGGESFGNDVLKPGDAEHSVLYRTVLRTEPDFEMPPKEAEKLTQQEAWWIRDWINAGAPWPDDDRAAMIRAKFGEGVTWSTSGGLNAEWTNRLYKREDLWCWKPLTKFSDDQFSGVSDSGVIDEFIQDRLEAAGLQAAPMADRRTLIRRASFDLLGLPPSPDEVAAFVSDPRSDDQVMAELVDRLLESPHYGEQWARHWLDVVRYADSSGFANDWERPNAWRYRDYVIRAFNKDLPYDQFIREQLAGDEIDPNDPEKRIAVGFLRMGPWEQTGMSVAKVTRQQFLDDITDSVGQVFLGHALQCCRCHDHKFDPIPTQDYYSLQAVFATTQFAEVDAAWLPEENLSGFDQDRHYLKQKLAANQAVLQELEQRQAENDRRWFRERNLPYATREEAKKAGEKELPPANNLRTPDEFGRDRIARKWQQRFPWELDRYKPIAFSVYNGRTLSLQNVASRLRQPAEKETKGTWQTTSILTGGDVFAPSAEVSPGVLTAVQSTTGFRVPEQPAGRRTAFAEWLTQPDNPLPSRVMANRIWQHHFGQGLAGNPNNFGATGKKPTHPELLDWLATSFMQHDWSVKRLHRIIMNSAAYRRSSEHPNHNRLNDADPERLLYAVFQPRRLDAEELRDTMLTVSGELNRTMGGIPVRPDMNMEAALQPRMIMGTFAPAYVPNPLPVDRNRRTIYALKLRGHRDPLMETFNQPGPDKSCELRDSSTISPQALTLLNGEETNDRALAMAQICASNDTSDSEVVKEVFRRAYGRNPDDEELQQTLTYWQRMTQRQAGLTFAPATFPMEIVRRASEENTGEPFTFTETLFAYKDYVPDLQPHEVDARIRGLADVCLAILNSNEFLYVY
ncbi:MAG: PSD1 domain-containing protein [Planctomycetaceae bacterium]|nr:PSD1 domain-containing protein [Planctomycetaceae bacterium]